MIISWLGYSCFRIETQSNIGKKATIVTDPFSSEGRLRLPRNLSAELVTVSLANNPRHNAVSEVSDKPFIIDGPGEFEVNDVSVVGIPVYHERREDHQGSVNTVCYFVAEDLRLMHLGGLKRRPEESDLQDLRGIDVLFVPIGGGEVLDAKQAADVVAQIEPRVVIPMYYSAGKIDEQLQGVEPFLKAMGATSPETVNKFKISSRALPQEGTKIVVIEPQ